MQMQHANTPHTITHFFFVIVFLGISDATSRKDDSVNCYYVCNEEQNGLFLRSFLLPYPTQQNMHWLVEHFPLVNHELALTFHLRITTLKTNFLEKQNYHTYSINKNKGKCSLTFHLKLLFKELIG